MSMTDEELTEKYDSYSFESVIHELVYLAGTYGKDHPTVKSLRDYIVRRYNDETRIY